MMLYFLLVGLYFVCSSRVLAESNDGFYVCQESGRPIPTEYLCDGYEDCSDGSDELDCGSAFGCESYEFQCYTADVCINMVFRCDGISHCPDGSDESECGKRDCKEWEHRCDNDKCVSELYVCDGDNDCGDNSDEVLCPPIANTCNPQTEWTCKSNDQCIAKNWRCDYEPDCPDGSDEEGCTVFNHRCGAGLFNCSHTECISSAKLCDGVQDCKTNVGADEDRSICEFLDCGEDQFACPEKCLDTRDKECDGVYDCMDGSDEMTDKCASSCLSTQFQCIDKHCTDLINRCNGIEECLDGSDEFLCTPLRISNCSEGEYMCQDGTSCIPDILFCDGNEQCNDGSDETLCSKFANHTTGNNCLLDNGHCEHKCNYNNHVYYCSCDVGYIIDGRNGRSCIDVDECDVYYGVCDQYCANSNGSYMCSCADGYVKSDQHGRCKATGSALELLLMNWFDIQKLNVRTGRLNITISDIFKGTALDYHYKHGLIFWSDISSETIMRSKFDGSERKSIVDLGVKNAEGIAVDWINDRVYWTDGELNRIEVANIDGSKRAVIFYGLDHPRDIVVDPLNGVLFWIEEQKIFKAFLDGSGKMEFLSGITSYVSWPSGLALDIYSQTLYWIDAGTRSIGMCRTDGNHQKLLYSGNITHPFGISVFEDKVYWTDIKLGAIYSINRITGKDFRKVLADIYKPLGIVTVHPLKQPLKEVKNDPCLVNNGNCDYLCLPGRVGHHSCHCPSFRNLLPDGKGCSKMNQFMLFSMTDKIHVLSFENTSRYDVEIPLVNTEHSNIVALDWDSQNDMIYWADAATKSIHSASINGSSQTVLVDVDIVSPGGLAVDWISHKLYWTDSELGRVYVSELNGSSVSVIVAVDDGRLTDIVVHPLKGLLFYGVMHSSNRKFYIRKAHLDGSHNKKLEVFEETVPILLTIDYIKDRLYWIDNINAKLESMFINGSDHEELLKAGILYKSKGLTEHDEYLYWTDEVDKTVHQIMKDPPYETTELISNRNGLKDISVFHRNRSQPAIQNPCWTNNGGCSHLCIGIPTPDEESISVSCKCPTGYMLQNDKKTCALEIDQFLLFSTRSRIGYISLDTQSNVDVTISIQPKPKSVISVDFDLLSNYVYWIEEDSSSIYRAPLSGGKRETVLSVGLIRPTALAIDYLGGNLYFADSETRRLEVCRLNGMSRKVLVADNNVGEVLSIVLDLNSQYIFWSSIHPSPQVFRALMDGSNPMAIIHSTEVTYPSSLAVDNRGPSSKLYVADSAEKRIKVFNTNGDGQVLFTITDSPIKGLVVDDDYVYWMDSSIGILNRSPKVNGDFRERFNTNMIKPSTLTIIRRTHQLKDSALPLHYSCKEDLCSNLCLPNWDLSRYTCACPTGIKDQVNCTNTPDLYIIFTTSDTIRRLSLDSTEYYDVVLVTGLQKVSYIDYHLKSLTNGTIYWSDPEHHAAIMSSNIDGSNVQPFLKFKSKIRGICVDWTTGNVYYIDAGVPSIEVVDHTGLYNRRLMNTSLGDPVDLTVMPSRGYIFWTDWSKKPSRIVRAKMDGSEIVTIIELGHQKPTQLTATADDGFLYWVDGHNGTIQKIKYDGTGHTFIWRNIRQPFGVAVYDKTIFWSDVFDGAIYRCNQKSDLSQKRKQYTERGFGTPKGITVVTKDRLGEIDGNYSGSACGYMNGGCAYLCLPMSEHKRKCACPSTVSDCVEYVGTYSWTVLPSSTTSSSKANSIFKTHTTTDMHKQTPVATTQLYSTIESGTVILNRVSIIVLIVTGMLLVPIFAMLVFILFMYWKYKKLIGADNTKTTLSKIQNNSAVNPLVFNTLYEKTSLPNDSSRPKFKPAYQLNNTMELQVKSKAIVEELQSTGNGNLKPIQKPKPKVLNYDTDNDVTASNEPEEYKITPVQSRRHHSSSSTTEHSHSPIVGVPVTVHFPTSSPMHVSAIKGSSPTKGTQRRVQFDTNDIVEPPPIPPRSNRLLSLNLSGQQQSPIDTPPSRPPMSAPATSPPPTFFSAVDVVPSVTRCQQFSARNPMFGRSYSSSSENDISGLYTRDDDLVGGSGFASERDISLKQ